MGDIPNIPPITGDQFIEKYIDGMRKILGSSSAATKRVIGSVIPSSSSSSAPSINAKVVKLQDCPEEFDMTKREAKLAIRATDLGSWTSLFPFRKEPTDSDPKTVQHWALVVYFPRGEIINLFEAGSDDGKLQSYRAQIAFKDFEIFEKSDYIGTVVTSPYQLLEIAQQVKTKMFNKYIAEYHAVFNNCQTWLTEYLKQINIACGSSLSLPDNYLGDNGLNN